MSELKEKRVTGLISGGAMFCIGLIVRKYPDFFLEWGSMNTLKGLMGWSWVMMIGGALIMIICASLLAMSKD